MLLMFSEKVCVVKSKKCGVDLKGRIGITIGASVREGTSNSATIA